MLTRLRRRVVTLNLEERSARLLTCRGKRVERWGSVPLEAGLIKDGLVLDPVRVGQKISALFQEQGVSKRGVLVSLTGAHSIPRLLELPLVKPAQLGETVLREAKRQMPVPLEGLYLSWQVVGRRDTVQQVFVLGVPREILDGQMEALQEARVEPWAMDLKPLALVRAVNRSEAIIVNLEAGSLDVIVVVDSLPSIMRTIALQEECSLEVRASLLEEELTRVLRFYNSNHEEAPLHRSIPIYLSGELVKVPGLGRKVEAAVGHQVPPLSPPVEYTAELPLPQYVVNLGLVLKGV